LCGNQSSAKGADGTSIKVASAADIFTGRAVILSEQMLQVDHVYYVVGVLSGTKSRGRLNRIWVPPDIQETSTSNTHCTAGIRLVSVRSTIP
jgi:hypothetical protein